MDFDAFHRRDVPELLGRGDGVRAAGALPAGASLALALRDGGAYTYRSTGADLTVVPGDDADVVVELDAGAFDDLVGEAWSVFGLLYGDRVAVRRGDFTRFAAWEAPLQALWFGRPIYDSDAVAALVDGDGAPLDVTRSFTLDDDDALLSGFLGTAGFLVLRGVLAEAEVAELAAVVAAERAAAAPGDGRSWWATRSDGVEVCCRLTYMAARTEVAARLSRDSRFARIGGLAGGELAPCTDRLDGMSVVIKNADVVSGLSDLPWHLSLIHI